jgi:hypothetical protein
MALEVEELFALGGEYCGFGDVLQADTDGAVVGGEDGGRRCGFW